ncbi:MAG: PadR family transcriptional regulator [Candidatus Nanopelagicales bacterium]|jgi:DNA-binding PadR family transcriptional regulator
MRSRAEVLEFSILGLLHDSPLHGYELRKRLTGVLGPFRAISYGSLYPALKDLQARDLIIQAAPDPQPVLTTKRARIVYELTGEGKEYFDQLVAAPGPDSWEDEPFAAHLAFFQRTPADVRMRILEGRRSRLEQRLATLRDSFTRAGERMDAYTERLQQHGLDSVEREVRWLDELIDGENRPDNRP